MYIFGLKISRYLLWIENSASEVNNWEVEEVISVTQNVYKLRCREDSEQEEESQEHKLTDVGFCTRNGDPGPSQTLGSPVDCPDLQINVKGCGELCRWPAKCAESLAFIVD